MLYRECHRDMSLTSWLLRSYSLQYYSFNCRKMGLGGLMWWQVRCCGALSWRNRAWIRKSWVKRREFQKSINFASILKIINGLNGYAPELVNGYRPEYVDHRNLDGNKIFNYNPDENALEYLAFGEDFIMDRIGDAQILNYNL